MWMTIGDVEEGKWVVGVKKWTEMKNKAEKVVKRSLLSWKMKQYSSSKRAFIFYVQGNRKARAVFTH